MRKLLSLIATMFVAFTPVTALAVCPGGTSVPDFAGKKIVVADDTLFFRAPEIELDIDGAPNAYGVKDQGVEDICNGLAPLQPPECRGHNQGECYVACQKAFASWDGRLETLTGKMCSIGLGGGSCSVPQARTQKAPRTDWFVSETSVKVAVPSDTSLGSWLLSQEAQLDSTAIPYFVIPSGFRHAPWDATPGDVGVIVSRPGDVVAAFLVGDTGGRLDEASAKLLAHLRGREDLPTERKTNAFGVKVDRLAGAKSGDFRVAIFRHSAPLLPPSIRKKTIVLDKSAAELPAWIARDAQDRLDRIGGARRVVECTE